MIWFKAIVFLNILLLNGCAFARHTSKEDFQSKTMMDVYAGASGQSQKDVTEFIKNNLKEQGTFGFTKPYIPVVNQPEVRKVWITDHKDEDNSDVLVAGHWVYLMIQPPSWFIDHQTVDTKFPIIIPVMPNQANQTKEPKSYGAVKDAIREDI